MWYQVVDTITEGPEVGRGCFECGTRLLSQSLKVQRLGGDAFSVVPGC